MSIDDVKKIFDDIQDDSESLHSGADRLDQVIRKLIAIEKKHLYQVESTSSHKRLEEVRRLIETELVKLMEQGNAS